MTGSHIDTVAGGGRYDGNLGVLAGLEVIETVMTAGVEPERPLAVGFFTDEEGARFAPDMLGSLVYVGGMPLERALDISDAEFRTLVQENEEISALLEQRRRGELTAVEPELRDCPGCGDCYIPYAGARYCSDECARIASLKPRQRC